MRDKLRVEYVSGGGKVRVTICPAIGMLPDACVLVRRTRVAHMLISLEPTGINLPDCRGTRVETAQHLEDGLRSAHMITDLLPEAVIVENELFRRCSLIWRE